LGADARIRTADASRQRRHCAWPDQGEGAHFARADAEAIKAPTLLIAGERSPASFRHILDGLESALRDSWRAVIPSASDASNIDDPKAFEREVLALLEER
jgi:pimeloyl-ACP methyl ester carboxylesterase